MQNFIYLIGDPRTREAAIVDPGWEVPTILHTLQQTGYRLSRVILTHTHFDHVMGLGELLNAVDVPVHVHEAEAGALGVAPSSIQPVRHGEAIQVGELSITLIHTPGHTPGSQCLLVGDQLLSGDTLFIRGCGRCDLPGGDPEAMFHSLTQTLKRLDDHTRVYPGHNYAEIPSVLLGEEKQANPYLKVQTLDQFLGLIGRPR